MTIEFRDYIRAEARSGNTDPPPVEKVVHIIRRGLRTFCGLGQQHRIWRISLDGAFTNVNTDVWTVCAACDQRAAATVVMMQATPQSSTETRRDPDERRQPPVEVDIDQLIEQFNEAREYAALCRSRLAQAESVAEEADRAVRTRQTELAKALAQ